MSEKTDILLSRYFSGEASPQELEQLDKWLSESTENEAYFDSMTMLYQQTVFTGALPEFNADEALQDFKAHMNKSEAPVKKKMFRLNYYIRAAAAVVILLVGLSTFFFIRNDSQTIQIASADITEDYTLYEDITVSLAPDTEIEYSKKDKSTVRLSGKATFSVEGNKENQFIVQAGETYVKHIGTVFTVSAYESDNVIIVEVHEGEVLFYTDTSDGINLTENQSASYNIVTKEFLLLTLSTTDSEIRFNATPLFEVVDILESYYRVSISLNSPQLRNMLITVSFEPSEPIENVLEIIAETLSLNISSNENSFIISQ